TSRNLFMIATHITVDIENYINGLGQNARLAAKELAKSSTAQKNQALTISAQVLIAGKKALLANNDKNDVNDVRKSGKSAALGSLP
ncbi:MAG: hypothetical protein ABIR84_06645, partial [Candidatus Nitrotoga sp.]